MAGGAKQIYDQAQKDIARINKACPALAKAKLGDMIETIYNQWGNQVASIAALQAIESEDRVDKQASYVEHVGLYIFDSASIQTADANEIVIPDDVTHPAAGRWKLVANLSAGFYFEAPVADKDTLTPPGVPAEGDRYLIAGVGAGGWTGKNQQIAEYTSDAAWEYTICKEGAIVYVDDENKMYVYNGTAWVDFGVIVDIPRTQQVWVDKAGNDTSGEVGNMTRPYLTIAAANAAITDAAANKRYMVHVGEGQWAEKITCKQYIDYNLGSAVIIPAADDCIVLEDDSNVFGGHLDSSGGYAFDVGSVTATPGMVLGTKYDGNGKLINTNGGGGANVKFVGLMPAGGAAVTVFADDADTTTLGDFYDCILQGANTSDSRGNFYNCDMTGAWTVADGIKAAGCTFTGAFSLATATAASTISDCTFIAGFTLLEGTLEMLGSIVGGAAQINHANAVLNAEGVSFGSTFTVTLGLVNVAGGRIIGAISVAGASTNYFSSVNCDGSFTILEATCIIDGSSVQGAFLLNHANAVARINGVDIDDTFTVTLGQADVIGGSITGAVSLDGTNANYFSGVKCSDAFACNEATAHLSGCTVQGAVTVTNAASIFEAEGSILEGAYTVTLGTGQIAGSKIGGAVSIAGTGTNFITGSDLASTLTVLEATLIFAGSSVTGAVVTNHANAVLFFDGSYAASTFDTTLGAATVIGAHIVGAVDVSGGAIILSASSSTGAITGTPTYIEDARYGQVVQDIGGAGIDMIRFTGVPNVDDAFTVAGRSYEFDTTGAGVNITRVPGNVSGTLDNAVTAINADAAGDGTVFAYKATGAGAGNGVLFLISEAPAIDFALVITVNVGGTMTAGIANSVSDKAAAFSDMYFFRYDITAQDVLALAAGEGIIIAGIPSTVAPRSISLLARDTASVILPINTYTLNEIQPGTNFYAFELVDGAGAAVFAAGDTIDIQVVI